MSFDRPRHKTIPADQPLPASQRRTFLDVLRIELEQRYGLKSGVVPRDGRLVLFVVGVRLTPGSVEIGCDLLHDGWWFTWAARDDRTIAPVEATTDTAAVIAAELGIRVRDGGHVRRPG